MTNQSLRLLVVLLSVTASLAVEINNQHCHYSPWQGNAHFSDRCLGEISSGSCATIESRHYHPNYCNTSRWITFDEDVESITIIFDARTFLESLSFDWIDFYDSNNTHIKKFSRRFHGNAELAREETFTIPGNSFRYRFYTDYSVVYWGFKFYAIGCRGEIAARDGTCLDCSPVFPMQWVQEQTPEVRVAPNQNGYSMNAELELPNCRASSIDLKFSYRRFGEEASIQEESSALAAFEELPSNQESVVLFDEDGDEEFAEGLSVTAFLSHEMSADPEICRENDSTLSCSLVILGIVGEELIKTWEFDLRVAISGSVTFNFQTDFLREQIDDEFITIDPIESLRGGFGNEPAPSEYFVGDYVYIQLDSPEPFQEVGFDVTQITLTKNRGQESQEIDDYISQASLNSGVRLEIPLLYQGFVSIQIVIDWRFGTQARMLAEGEAKAMSYSIELEVSPEATKTTESGESEGELISMNMLLLVLGVVAIAAISILFYCSKIKKAKTEQTYDQPPATTEARIKTENENQV